MADATLQSLLDRRAHFLAFVSRRVANRELAEDILQTAYMRALQHSSTLRLDESAVAWFYSVLRNAVVDYYRRDATETTALMQWGSDHGVIGPNAMEPATPDPSMRTFVCGCIQAVLPHLRPSYAELLREVDLAEQPLSQFAERHQLTPGNAAVRAHRARAALRTELARFCGACSLHACLDCVCKHPQKATAAV